MFVYGLHFCSPLTKKSSTSFCWSRSRFQYRTLEFLWYALCLCNGFRYLASGQLSCAAGNLSSLVLSYSQCSSMLCLRYEYGRDTCFPDGWLQWAPCFHLVALLYITIISQKGIEIPCMGCERQRQMTLTSSYLTTKEASRFLYTATILHKSIMISMVTYGPRNFAPVLDKIPWYFRTERQTDPKCYITRWVSPVVPPYFKIVLNGISAPPISIWAICSTTLTTKTGSRFRKSRYWSTNSYHTISLVLR